MIEFGKRGPKNPTSNEQARILTPKEIHDTLNGIPGNDFNNDLKKAIDSDPNIKARASEIVMLINQDREKDITQESLRGITDAFNAVRGKK